MMADERRDGWAHGGLHSMGGATCGRQAGNKQATCGRRIESSVALLFAAPPARFAGQKYSLRKRFESSRAGVRGRRKLPTSRAGIRLCRSIRQPKNSPSIEGRAAKTPLLLGSASPHILGADEAIVICCPRFVEVVLTPIYQINSSSFASTRETAARVVVACAVDATRVADAVRDTVRDDDAASATVKSRTASSSTSAWPARRCAVAAACSTSAAFCCVAPSRCGTA